MVGYQKNGSRRPSTKISMHKVHKKLCMDSRNADLKDHNSFFFKNKSFFLTQCSIESKAVTENYEFENSFHNATAVKKKLALGVNAILRDVKI